MRGRSARIQNTFGDFPVCSALVPGLLLTQNQMVAVLFPLFVKCRCFHHLTLTLFLTALTGVP